MQSKNIGVKFTALIACRNFNFLSLHYEGIYCARCTGSAVPNITGAAMDFFEFGVVEISAGGTLDVYAHL